MRGNGSFGFRNNSLVYKTTLITTPSPFAMEPPLLEKTTLYTQILQIELGGKLTIKIKENNT